MSGSFTLYPLGGLGEIGMNCFALATEQTMLLVDCGLMFPEEYLFGVDVVIPRFDFVLAHKDKLKGIIITHGHEDHIGALPWLMPYVDAPIYSSDFTCRLIESKLKEYDLARFTDFRRVRGGERVDFGDLAVNFFPVCHSIIEGYALGIETPAGRVLHTGDFKIDQRPLGGHATDMAAIGRFAAPGVQLLLSDSTNIEREGFALTEAEIQETFADLFRQTRGRILITLFSSHIQRLQQIFHLAAAHNRVVAVSGKSLLRNIEIARDAGYMDIKPGVLVDIEGISRRPHQEVVVLLTGSQGEPLSALSRLSLGEHRQLQVERGDLLVMSSRFIPGNVRAITRIINRLYKLGAEVLYEKVQNIHASGHAHRAELSMMLEAVKPKFFIPVHGEYRHLVKHCRLAVERGVAKERAMVVEDGQPVTFLADGGIRLEENIVVESIYVDGKGVGDVGQTVLKERQLLAGEGLVIVNLVIDAQTGEITLGPDILSKGFVFEQQYAHVLEDAKCIVLDIFENVPPGQVDKLKERIRSALRRFFRKILDRDPVVVPVVISL